jgi:dTMP kinase
MKGIFITVEGLDGAGKSTQIDRLCRCLIDKGYEVLRTREPGGTRISDKIRALILDPQNAEMTPRTEALLYMASRAQHTDELIRPALAEGKVVISDRYADSTLVYQGVARGLPFDSLLELGAFSTTGLKPDLTVLLDGDADVLSARLENRGEKDRLEAENIQFHRRVREGFLRLALSEPDRFRVVDATGDVETVYEAVRHEVFLYLEQKRGS